MARYRKVDVRVWADEKFGQLSKPKPNAQTLWLFFLTNPLTTCIPGLFSGGEAAISEALGWTIRSFRIAFAELSERGMAKASWSDRLIWIPKAIKYNAPESPNVVKSWKSAWDELPECKLKDEAFRALSEHFSKETGKGFREAFREAFGEGLREALPKGWVELTDDVLKHPSPNQEQEQEQEQEIEAPPSGPKPSELQATWNELANPDLPRWDKLTDDRRKKAKARLRADPDLGHWRKVINRINASAFCLGQNDRGWRASPDWLLQPDTATKVLEGKYDTRGPPKRSADPDRPKPLPVYGPEQYEHLYDMPPRKVGA
jgi:hypothetical protein